MSDLTQTISNLVGILLGVVGAVGVGYFVFGAYQYLAASGAPHQMERGKTAMLTALAGIVLAWSRSAWSNWSSTRLPTRSSPSTRRPIRRAPSRLSERRIRHGCA